MLHISVFLGNVLKRAHIYIITFIWIRILAASNTVWSVRFELGITWLSWPNIRVLHMIFFFPSFLRYSSLLLFTRYRKKLHFSPLLASCVAIKDKLHGVLLLKCHNSLEHPVAIWAPVLQRTACVNSGHPCFSRAVVVWQWESVLSCAESASCFQYLLVSEYYSDNGLSLCLEDPALKSGIISSSHSARIVQCFPINSPAAGRWYCCL